MNLKKAPPILSRILLAISSLVMVGVVFYFVSKSLEPVETLPMLPPRQAEVFNPKADITKNPAFQKLKPTHMEPVPDLPMGRSNPFDPVATGAIEIVSGGGLAVPRSALRLTPVSTTTGDLETQPETQPETQITQ